MSMHPSSFLDKDKLPSPIIQTSPSNSSSLDGKRHARQRETQFILKHGRRHHSYDSEKAPYPMSYDKDIVELYVRIGITAPAETVLIVYLLGTTERRWITA